MSTAQDHYESLLADHYSWMFGISPQMKAAEQRDLLTRMNVSAKELAIDLGAGSGFQSMALADLGFERVLAVDTSAKLLQELRLNSSHPAIEPILDDMINISQYVAPATADTVVCMGDTLPHLPSREAVSSLFVKVFQALRVNGRFVLTFRDLSLELKGVDRFISVRATADKVMTCFLEYLPEAVMVHDLIHVHENGSWKLLKSCYPKLRLAAGEVRHDLEKIGFKTCTQEHIRGLTLLVVEKL